MGSCCFIHNQKEITYHRFLFFVFYKISLLCTLICSNLQHILSLNYSFISCKLKISSILYSSFDNKYWTLLQIGENKIEQFQDSMKNIYSGKCQGSDTSISDFEIQTFHSVTFFITYLHHFWNSVQVHCQWQRHALSLLGNTELNPGPL